MYLESIDSLLKMAFGISIDFLIKKCIFLFIKIYSLLILGMDGRSRSGEIKSSS